MKNLKEKFASVHLEPWLNSRHICFMLIRPLKKLAFLKAVTGLPASTSPIRHGYVYVLGCQKQKI
jgi:hypothetical protein